MSNKLLVIGATNIDIFTTTSSPYLINDSNPAKVNIGIGGVGCNIATNLNTLNNEVHFITALGNDLFAELAKNHFQKRGINIENSLDYNHSSSVYLGVMDEDNDLFLGINDMDIVKQLKVSFLQGKHDFISEFNIIVIDNNLSVDTIEYLVKTYNHKTIIMDAVSAKKVTKLRNLLKYITVLKVNRLELSVLSKEATVKEQITDLLNEGLKEIIVTDKEKDVFYANKTELITVKPYDKEVIVNASGAGDAFISGFTHGVNQGLTINEKLEQALKLANLTLDVTTSTIEKE